MVFVCVDVLPSHFKRLSRRSTLNLAALGLCSLLFASSSSVGCCLGFPSNIIDGDMQDLNFNVETAR